MLRIALRAALVAAAFSPVVLVVACASSASSGGSPSATSGFDAGSSETGTPAAAEAGPDADATTADATSPEGGIDGAPAPLTTVIFAHASPSLPALRLCWVPAGLGLPASGVPFPSDNEMPASNYPGIPVGGAVWLTDPAQVASVAGATIYALRAWPLGQDRTTKCADLLCPPGGQNCRIPNLDYWRIGTIAPAQLRTGASNIIAVSGCRGGDDATASVARCGASWSAATGNLHLEVVPVPAAAFDPGDGGLLVQATQLSPGLQALQGAAGMTSVSFGPADMSGAQPIAQLQGEAELLPSSPASVSLPAGPASFGQLGFAVDVQGIDAGAAAHLWMSLALAQELVSPSQDPTAYYGAGGTYVVAVLGDPNAPHATGDAGYDGTGLHVLVLPTAKTTP
jgi:hypothetical protein